MKGTVKFFNDMKGFGFITAEDGKEYFVHQSGLEEGLTITDNDAVEFDTEQGDRGLKAVNVKKASAEEKKEEAPAEETTEETKEEPAEEKKEEVTEEKEE